MRAGAGRIAAVATVLLLAGCTGDGAEPAASPSPSAGQSEAASASDAAEAPGSSGSSGSSSPPGPPPWVTETLPPEASTRPLVLATNARRPALRIPRVVAEWVVEGVVEDWDQLGQRPGRLRVTERTDRLNRLPMDTIAVVVADSVTPAVRVAEVDGVDPLRDPDDYPLQVQGPAHPPVTTMTVVGDVMLGREVGARAARIGDPSAALRPMADRLAAADLTVGNLESTLSTAGAPTQGGDSFAADPRVRAGLRSAGFDALGLANNHLGDFGSRALVQTVDRLRAGGLATFGAGRDLARARQPVVLTRHGVRFGFLAFNAIGETPEAGPGRPGVASVSMPPRTGPLDETELGRVLADVRRLAGRVDVVTVLPHWGTQYTNRPEPVQGVVARALVRAGADLVVGGHPHWVQGASMVGDALVVNSLGNFVFDMDFMAETQEGLVLEATFWGDRLVGARFVPYRIGADLAPRVVPPRRARHTLDLFWEFSGLGAS